MKRQTRLAFRRHLDSLSPLIPHGDELFIGPYKGEKCHPLHYNRSHGVQSQRLGGRLSARRQETVTGFLHLKLTSLKPKSTKSYFTIKLHILKQNSSNSYIKCPCVPQVLQAVARLSGSEMGPRLGTPADTETKACAATT